MTETGSASSRCAAPRTMRGWSWWSSARSNRRSRPASPAADLVVASSATAVIAYDDMIALGVMTRMNERGIEVGEQLSVIGVDDSLMSGMAYPVADIDSCPRRRSGNDGGRPLGRPHRSGQRSGVIGASDIDARHSTGGADVHCGTTRCVAISRFLLQVLLKHAIWSASLCCKH